MESKQTLEFAALDAATAYFDAALPRITKLSQNVQLLGDTLIPNLVLTRETVNQMPAQLLQQAEKHWESQAQQQFAAWQERVEAADADFSRFAEASKQQRATDLEALCELLKQEQ